MHVLELPTELVERCLEGLPELRDVLAFQAASAACRGLCVRQVFLSGQRWDATAAAVLARARPRSVVLLRCRLEPQCLTHWQPSYLADLTLTGMTLGSPHIAWLAAAVAHSAQLQQCRVRDCRLGTAGAESLAALSRALGQARRLRVLDLSRNRLAARDTLMFLERLPPAVDTLDLSFNRLPSAAEGGQALLRLAGLRKVNLCFTGLHESTLALLWQGGPAQPVRWASAWLDGNSGVETLPAASLPLLTSLSLMECTGLRARPLPPNIAELFLGFCPLDVDTLAQQLQGCRRLVRLSLCRSGLSAADLASLLQRLRGPCPLLQAVDVRGNGWNNNGANNNNGQASSDPDPDAIPTTTGQDKKPIELIADEDDEVDEVDEAGEVENNADEQ